MHRTVVQLALVGLIVLTPGLASAKGGGSLELFGPFNPKPIPVMRAGVPTPSISPGDAFGGCGRGSYRDLTTHPCRGPADVTHWNN